MRIEHSGSGWLAIQFKGKSQAPQDSTLNGDDMTTQRHHHRRG